LTQEASLFVYKKKGGLLVLVNLIGFPPINTTHYPAAIPLPKSFIE
jgi:hypothetical protein